MITDRRQASLFANNKFHPEKSCNIVVFMFEGLGGLIILLIGGRILSQIKDPVLAFPGTEVKGFSA